MMQWLSRAVQCKVNLQLIMRHPSSASALCWTAGEPSLDDRTAVSAALAVDASRTPPTKRNPRRATVRMSCCSVPVSPIARRAALTLLVGASSETDRPCHTACRSSSLLRTRSRCRTRWTSRSNTCGSTWITVPVRCNSRHSHWISQSPNANVMAGLPKIQIFSNNSPVFVLDFHGPVAAF
jgi:hypothetical protein